MSEESKNKRLLILGSGFSKAVSDKMPVVQELVAPLNEKVERDEELGALKNPRYQYLLSQPELLLTYLSQDQPWKEPWETPKEWALFVRISRWLAKHIEDCEDRAFKDQVPGWAKRLAQWLHKTKTSVITFNYDTVLERICYRYVSVKVLGIDARSGQVIEANQPIYSFNLYRLPLTIITHREAGTDHAPPQETFHLIKLHGSINWFYSGGEYFPGEQIYLREIDSESPKIDMTKIPEGYPPLPPGFDPKKELERLLSDKAPLIIPPVAEKSRFYLNQTIRSLWGQAREYLAQAEEIYCVGYSLPDTDLTTKLLLQTACAGREKTLYIVNIVKGEKADDDKRALRDRYEKAFPPTVKIDDRFVYKLKEPDKHDKAVKDMTEFLCNLCEGVGQP